MRSASWIPTLAVVLASSLAAIAGAQAGSARERCEARCDERHRGDAGAREECRLSCPPPDGLTPVERCQFQCRQESRLCDRGCASIADDGERRGCLRRCGSLHVSCPRACERDPREAPAP